MDKATTIGEDPYESPRVRARGSIHLVALGFCAAVVVLLAIPILEALLTPGKPVEASAPHTPPK